MSNLKHAPFKKVFYETRRSLKRTKFFFTATAYAFKNCLNLAHLSVEINVKFIETNFDVKKLTSPIIRTRARFDSRNCESDIQDKVLRNVLNPTTFDPKVSPVKSGS
jgi:hypothetical protein